MASDDYSRADVPFCIYTGGIWNIKTAGNSGIVLKKRERGVLPLSLIAVCTVMIFQKIARELKRNLKIAGYVPGMK